MEDIIIKSERYNSKKVFSNTFLVLTFVIFIVFKIIVNIISFGDIFAIYARYFEFGEFEELFAWPENFWCQSFYSLGSSAIAAFIIFLWLKSYELTITDKRAYGFAAFGKRVDLPVDSIAAIGLGWLKSIKITTASGKISFLLIKNRDEMYETISKLIIERQSKEAKSEAVIIQETSNADELKKFKDLLDSGVITQDEFDTKKKQLLGL